MERLEGEKKEYEISTQKIKVSWVPTFSFSFLFLSPCTDRTKQERKIERWKVEVELHAFLISAPVGSEWSATQTRSLYSPVRF